MADSVWNPTKDEKEAVETEAPSSAPAPEEVAPEDVKVSLVLDPDFDTEDGDVVVASGGEEYTFSKGKTVEVSQAFAEGVVYSPAVKVAD